MEEERVDQYIHVATKPKLLKEVETEVGMVEIVLAAISCGFVVTDILSGA